MILLKIEIRLISVLVYCALLDAQSTTAEQGEAKQSIFNYKTIFLRLITFQVLVP